METLSLCLLTRSTYYHTQHAVFPHFNATRSKIERAVGYSFVCGFLRFVFSLFPERDPRGDILSISPVRTLTNAHVGGDLTKIHNCYDITPPLSGELKLMSF
jgi:hypothetical protein